MRKLILLLFSVLLAHSGIALADVDDGLVAHYPFNGNAIDETGNGHNGTVTGAYLTEDRFGIPESAYRFDRSGDCDFITVPASIDLQLLSWTITGWIQVITYPSVVSALILNKGEDDNAKYNFDISFWPSQHGHVNSISSQYETCWDEYDHPLHCDGIELYEWVFFASVRDHSSGWHRLYINGVQEAAQQWSNTPCANYEDLYIGFDVAIGRDCFDGVIDDIRIYNRPLSEAEIEQLFKEIKVTASPLLYAPIPACRIVDTRVSGAGGPFLDGEKRQYHVYGGPADMIPQGGNSAGCASPSGEPSAVHLNVTAVPTYGSGNFKAYPNNASPPNASLTNYKSGAQNIANAGTIKTFVGDGPEIEVMNSYGVAFLVIDVLGYYYPEP